MIALSINNWNQSRINAATEKQILEEIKKDLTETLEIFNNDLKAHNVMLSSTIKSMQYLQQNEVHKDTFTKILIHSFGDTRTYIKSGGMEYFKSKGLAIVELD